MIAFTGGVVVRLGGKLCRTCVAHSMHSRSQALNISWHAPFPPLGRCYATRTDAGAAGTMREGGGKNADRVAGDDAQPTGDTYKFRAPVPLVRWMVWWPRFEKRAIAGHRSPTPRHTLVQGHCA